LRSIANIRSDFAVLDDWEDRYRYVIELGRELDPMPSDIKTEASKVRGCASQVWIVSEARPRPNGSGKALHFQGDSDAHIVRGLISILFSLYQGRTSAEILAVDPAETFDALGLKEHLTPQRSNGLASMVERIRADARAAAAETVS
jgi:cysteine desulfuration protein SufE